MATDTQNARILNYLKAGLRLTPMDALTMCGCFRLAARIHDLRAMGHKIESEIVKRDGKQFAVYSISGETPDNHQGGGN